MFKRILNLLAIAQRLLTTLLAVIAGMSAALANAQGNTGQGVVLV